MLRMIQDQIAIALKGCTDPQLLLACSGGVDSMVLLDLLQKSHYTFGVAHCNFGLRSSASDLDAQMVEH
ncbi:MAG: ATP-binding protein, partial [Flavobacteriaceae bacterium]